MTLNHLVLIGGGHTNVLLIRKWLMNPKLKPDIPVSIISRDSYLVYSAMFPSVIAKSIRLEDCLIDLTFLARQAKISFIKGEVENVDFNLKEIILKNRAPINYSKLVINCGSETRISDEFEDLVKNQIAFPIKPFFKAYDLITKEDNYNSEDELPFVIVGSGLAAIEVSFALRKRWPKRVLKIVCNTNIINSKILKSLRQSNIHIVDKITFAYRKIILCTGNSPSLWVENNILNLDSKGRIITNQKLNVRNLSGVYAVGDCAVIDSHRRPSSGIFAVKVSNVLARNIKKDIQGESLKKWFPQKFGLQILNSYSRTVPKAFAIYSNLVFGPSFLIWYLKNIIDKLFIKSFLDLKSNMDQREKNNSLGDCRGCAAKIPQIVLNESLRNAQLDKFITFPEDASEIFQNDTDTILQSVDGFPALISDPWLNAKITTLHACSDLWACGLKLSSAQALISLPKVEKEFQNYLFSQCLNAIKTTVEEQGGKLIGGHTFESRSLINQPYSLGIDISLTVQGILRNSAKPWQKSGLKPGDILLMSRPLGVGIFFAAQMRNINLLDNSSEIMKNLITSQQPLINQIYILQEKFGEPFINAATDITGFGFLGHLKEMIDSSNSLRKKENLPSINVLLDLSAFKAYRGIHNLIRKGIRSTLFDSNKLILDEILKQRNNKRSISFIKENKFDQTFFREQISLLLDPQTCGPLLISCNPKYETFLKDQWYKVGHVEIDS